MLYHLGEALLRTYSRVAPTERGGYRLARLVRRLRPRRRWRSTFTVPGKLRFELDLGTYPDATMAFGLYELDTARLLARLIRPGAMVVDAGANLGYFTCLMARRVGPAGHVHAFEPDPANRARLRHHLTLNRLADRVTVHPDALSDRRGTATLHRLAEVDAKANHGCSTLFTDQPGDGRGATEVQTVRLDEVLAGCPVAVIKMDIEGAEALAIEGMAGLLRRAAPPVVVGEVNRAAAATTGVPAMRWVDRALQQQPRYEAWTIGWRARRLTPAAGPVRDVTNVVLRPGHRRPASHRRDA